MDHLWNYFVIGLVPTRQDFFRIFYCFYEFYEMEVIIMRDLLVTWTNSGRKRERRNQEQL